MKAAKPVLLTLTMFAVALAGCADDPATGDFSSSSNGLTVDGSIDFAFQAAQNPYSVSGVGEAPQQVCDAASNDPSGGVVLPQCTPASTTAAVHIMTLADPGEGNSYNVVLLANGSVFKDLGALTLADGMYDLEAAFDEDLDGQFDTVALRFGEFTLATATATNGANPFEIADGAPAHFEASYTGKDLTVTVTGLQDGISYTGWLVSIDEETGAKTHEESFSLSEGENTYAAELSIDQYSELHIHVGGSLVNVAIGAIA